MGRLRKGLVIALAGAAIALAGCSSTVGLTLDQSVRIGIEGESGYAKLDFPASWNFQGVQGDQTVSKPTEGDTYRSAMVGPGDVDKDPTSSIAAAATENATFISPDSSDDRIYQYFDDMLKQTYDNPDVKSKNITRDGDSTIVTYEFAYPYDGDTMTVETKLVFIGDYIYSIYGYNLSKADDTDEATVKAIVADYGYVTNSQ